MGGDRRVYILLLLPCCLRFASDRAYFLLSVGWAARFGTLAQELQMVLLAVSKQQCFHRRGGSSMISPIHTDHPHVHDAQCGHIRVRHEGHTDYLYEGHLHFAQEAGGYEEHVIAESLLNPTGCTPVSCPGDHQRQEAVPHADHTDYLVAGHLHHPHGDHCDDHGPLSPP